MKMYGFEFSYRMQFVTPTSHMVLMNYMYLITKIEFRIQ